MEQEVDNYARFYVLLKRLPGADKETLVWQYTGGRTDSLRQMTRREYDKMCHDMESVAGYDERKKALIADRKKQRSICLHLMQKLGIDTTEWVRVNEFCRHPRITGKEFRELRIDELEELERKLRAIRRKGGIRDVETDSPIHPVVLTVSTEGKAS